MRVGVLISTRSWYWHDLCRAADNRLELVPLDFERLHVGLGGVVPIGTSDGWWPLTGLAGVLVRTMPPGSLEQVVFRMDLLGCAEAQGCTVLNPPRAVEVAVDKYLASARLAAAGLAVPRTVVCQTVPEALAAFERLGGDVVVKPLFGSEGRGILRVQDPDLALRVAKALVQLGAIVYLQEFVPHSRGDVRILVLDDQHWTMQRVNPCDWRSNISRGAQARPFTPPAEWVETARAAARAVGAPLAGVDLLPDAQGRLWVLEVNAVPGWRALARTLGVDIAGRILDYMLSKARSS